jgi:hypothetical protein
MRQVLDALAGVKIGDSVTYENLTVFPVYCADTETDYLTLDEALEQKCVEITEINEAGSVPELKLFNRSHRRVFLLDGEELIGAKQNRILNLSILVPADKTLVVPVSCVESGRWNLRGRNFSTVGRTQYARGRARKTVQVSESMRSRGERRSDQHDIWNDIREKSARFAVHSETSAMSDLYEQQASRLEKYTNTFSTREGQCGALFAIGGAIAGLDLFDSSETLRKLFPKLVRGYALDALDMMNKPDRMKSPDRACPDFYSDATAGFDTREGSSDRHCSPKQAYVFLRRLISCRTEKFPAIGEGQDLRLSGGNITGAALVVGLRLIHLCAFRNGG